MRADEGESMDVDGRTIWQVAAGDTDRDYSRILLDWDVVAVGPGEFGAWPGCQPRILEGGYKQNQNTILRRLCEDMKAGDLVVLRLGTMDVLGVGEVVGDYEWLDDFGDIDGWDLQHVRRVKWLWKSGAEPKKFPAHTLKWGDSVLTMTSDEVKNWIKAMPTGAPVGVSDLRKLPESCVHNAPVAQISPGVINNFLFDKGMSAQSIDALMKEMSELVRLAKWYYRAENPPSEYETVAYLAVPLLKALGWTQQKMAIEWNKVDVALFSAMPRCDQNLVVAVEAKRRGNSCLTARSQAENYASQQGRKHCKRIIVTDGIRYGVYLRKEDDSFPEKPQAYLNLTRMMDHYPILECKGAHMALLMMSHGWDKSYEEYQKSVTDGGL